MIEVMAARIRWLALASNVILIGVFVFLAIAKRAHDMRRPMAGSLRAGVTVVVVTLLLGLLGLLATARS